MVDVCCNLAHRWADCRLGNEWHALQLDGGTGAQVSPEQELVERFAPVAMLREREADCDHDGEGLLPGPVDFLFNNPDIKLVANAGGDKRMTLSCWRDLPRKTW